MFRDKNGEPVFPPGALWSLIALIIAVVAPVLLRSGIDAVLLPAPPKEMPFALREAAADCILTDNPRSCAIYEAAKPDYPERHQ